MFYLTLSNNSSTDHFPDNTLTHFMTRTPPNDGFRRIVGNRTDSWYNIKKGEAWLYVDVSFEVNQLQRHTCQQPAGYYPSPKRILKAIEVKKHRTPLQRKFDIRMNEIDHKIGIAVKKDCQVTISPLLNTCWDLNGQYSRTDITQGTKFSIRVLLNGRTKNGGRRSSTTFENSTGRRKRHIDRDQSFRPHAVLSSGIKK